MSDLEKDTNIKTGIVVPTLGRRPELLIKCLQSIRDSGDCYICIVAPVTAYLGATIPEGLWDVIIDDPKSGLAGAINAGVNALPAFVEYCNWLGDDDLLEPMTLGLLEKKLDSSPMAVLVYGNCLYINSDGRQIWISNFGKIAARLIRIGPCLIPQPGSLFRRQSFEKINGLNTNLGWAFDFDLFIRLSKVGSLIYLDQNVASFRWHNDSLTVGQRRKSVEEASKVRLMNYSNIIKKIAKVWEPLIVIATYHGPKLFRNQN